MKKILTLTLSLLMAFTLCLTASAEDNDVVAKIGDQTYTSLQDAIEKASDCQTIVLQKSISVKTLTVSGNKTITLDMGGNTITQDLSTYKDKEGYDALININNGANLTITGNGKFVGPNNEQGGTYDSRALICVNNSGSTLRIVDGEFTAGGSGSSGMYGIYAYYEGTIILGDESLKTGPTIHTFAAAVGQNHTTSPSYITIYGGEYTTDVKLTGYEYFCAPIYASSTGEITIYGGKFNGWYGISSRYNTSKQTIKIQGGTFNNEKASLFIDNIQPKGEEVSTRDISITGGTFSSDVSAYLATDYNIAKVNDVYKVTKNGDTLPVETITPAVEETVYKTLDGKTVTTSEGTVEISASTELVLTTTTKKEEDIKEQKDTIVEEVVKKITAESKIIEASNVSLIPLDITLTAKTSGGDKTITNLGEGNEITVTLYLDDVTLNLLKGKDIKVVRIHDGKTEALDANLIANALTFKTSKFSTYVIAYADTKPTSTTTPETTEPKQESIKSYDAKDKNHDGVISCAEEMNSANWTWSETKKACVYRVTNTSAK